MDSQNLDSRINDLKHSVIDYRKMSNASYSENDVRACVAILNRYQVEMAKTSSKEEGMMVVKATVLALNDLNRKCDEGLIETGERESIAVIIIGEGSKKGYNTTEEDITEAWREW